MILMKDTAGEPSTRLKISLPIFFLLSVAALTKLQVIPTLSGFPQISHNISLKIRI